MIKKPVVLLHNAKVLGLIVEMEIMMMNAIIQQKNEPVVKT